MVDIYQVLGYLKVPKNFGEYHQKKKVNNQNGTVIFNSWFKNVFM